MYRTSRVIIESKPLEGEARHMRRCPVRSVSTVWAYFPDNDRRSTHNPLHRDFQRPKDSCSEGGDLTRHFQDKLTSIDLSLSLLPILLGIQ